MEIVQHPPTFNDLLTRHRDRYPQLEPVAAKRQLISAMGRLSDVLLDSPVMREQQHQRLTTLFVAVINAYIACYNEQKLAMVGYEFDCFEQVIEPQFNAERAVGFLSALSFNWIGSDIIDLATWLGVSKGELIQAYVLWINQAQALGDVVTALQQDAGLDIKESDQ